MCAGVSVGACVFVCACLSTRTATKEMCAISFVSTVIAISHQCYYVATLTLIHYQNICHRQHVAFVCQYKWSLTEDLTLMSEEKENTQYFLNITKHTDIGFKSLIN